MIPQTRPAPPQKGAGHDGSSVSATKADDTTRLAPIAVLDPRGRRARRDLDGLLAEARAAIEAATFGDLAAVYDGHRALNRAVMLLLDYRLDVG